MDHRGWVENARTPSQTTKSCVFLFSSIVVDVIYIYICVCVCVCALCSPTIKLGSDRSRVFCLSAMHSYTDVMWLCVSNTIVCVCVCVCACFCPCLLLRYGSTCTYPVSWMGSE